MTLSIKISDNRSLRTNPGRVLLPNHVVLRIKCDSNGNRTKLKARIVSGGHLQVYGRDFDTICSPVVEFTVVFAVLAIWMQSKWNTCHVDATAAFINGDIDRENYVSYPVNLPKCSESLYYFRIHKELYELKQAPLQL